MILEIVKFPDKRLRQKCRPLTESEIKGAVIPEIGKTFGEFAHDLAETMMSANGLGLAAPQVGVAVRVFALRIDASITTPIVAIAINPVLSKQSGVQKLEEGCLSLPGIKMRTERHMKVVLNSPAFNRELKLQALMAACAQHECDHLDGILITDSPRHRIV